MTVGETVIDVRDTTVAITYLTLPNSMLLPTSAGSQSVANPVMLAEELVEVSVPGPAISPIVCFHGVKGPLASQLPLTRR